VNLINISNREEFPSHDVLIFKILKLVHATWAQARATRKCTTTYLTHDFRRCEATNLKDGRPQELFDPVGTDFKSSDENEVIKEANDSQYGLGAPFFTKNFDRALRVSHRIHVGTC